MSRGKKERQRVVDGTVVISGVTIEQRKVVLQRRGQELERRLTEIDRQGQRLQQERGQVIADMNAVSGALQLCEELLRGLVNPTPTPGPVGEPVTLEEWKEMPGADSVGVPEQGQDEN